MTITLFLFAMITVPKQLYVGLNQRDDSDVPLGFATPFGTDKAFERRKETVDRWARPRSYFDRELGTYVDNPLIPPKVIDNTPVTGFQISKSVRRTGWNGGNVVWRLEDPRGFELEISSANFAAIVNHCNMDKGLITSKCVWGREGAQNVLLPEGSEPYNEAFKATARAAKKVKKSEIKAGNMVELKDGRVVEYLGEFNVLYHESEQSNRWLHNSTTTHKFVVRKRMVIREIRTADEKDTWVYTLHNINVGDSYLSFSSALNVSSIVDAKIDPRTSEQIAQEVHDWLYKTRWFDQGGKVVAVQALSKIVPTYHLVPTTLQEIKLGGNSDSVRLYAFFETQADFKQLMAYECGSSYSQGRGHQATTNISEGTWATSGSNTTTYKTLHDLRDRTWHKIVVKWGDMEYDLHYT